MPTCRFDLIILCVEKVVLVMIFGAVHTLSGEVQTSCIPESVVIPGDAICPQAGFASSMTGVSKYGERGFHNSPFPGFWSNIFSIDSDEDVDSTFVHEILEVDIQKLETQSTVEDFIRGGPDWMNLPNKLHLSHVHFVPDGD